MVQTSCDRDDSKNHPLIRNFRGTSYYEDRGPVKPRKDFSCSACEKNIPLGTDVKFTIKAYGWGGDWPSTEICGSCMLLPEVLEAHSRIRKGEFNQDG